MPYTQADLDAIRAAKLAKAKGESPTFVQARDGSAVRYSEASMADLDRMEAQAERDVAAAAAAADPSVPKRIRSFRAHLAGA